ncbi:replication-relaxation family protein [Tsukamurella spumae]
MGRFGQVASGQIESILFHENASNTPCQRALVRLVKTNMLRRMGERPIGGWAHGSGQYVYQLDRKGWNYLRREGKYQPYRVLDRHRLQITESYVQLVHAERERNLRLQETITEPDTWFTVGQADIRPDLYVCFDLPRGVRRRVWLEIDMATERRQKITDKIARYRHAHRFWGDVDMFGGHFPYIVFVAIDEERASELRHIIGEIPESARKLFDVRTTETLHELWTN